MTLITRKLLFYGLVAVFIITATSLIFYSNGWRLDLETLSINKLGGLFIEAYPDGASIEIEKANFTVKPGLLKNSVLIANLFPKTYSVEISKEGYQTWVKNFEVKPSMVTETYPAVLLPQSPSLQLIAEKIQDFWANSKITALKDQFGKLQINSKPAQGSQIIGLSPDGSLAITFDSKNKTYFLISLPENTATNLSLIVKNRFGEKITAIKFNPEKNSLLAIATDKNLYSFDSNSLSLSKIDSGAMENIITEGGYLLWTRNKKLYTSNETLRGQELFKVLEKEAVNPEAYFKISPDNKKIAVLFNEGGRAKIKIYFLEDDPKLNRKKGETTILDSGFAENRLEFEWYENSYYLFINSGGYLTFIEIDNNPPMNVQLLSNSASKFQYDSANNLLYALSNGSVYEIKIKIK